MASSGNIFYAAIDIGTSQIKIGVCSEAISPAFQIIAKRNTIIESDDSGKAVCSYNAVSRSIYELLSELEKWLADKQADQLYIGICGLVSSYLIWDKESGKPVDDNIPIWLDRSCGPKLNELFSKLSGGKDIIMLGTYLPKGTNWLLSKIYFNKKRKLKINELYLQLGDAIFAELTGKYITHFSSQVSVAHNVKRTYSEKALKLLGCSENHFPEIKNDQFFTMETGKISSPGFPSRTFVIPALGDFYASFIGVELKKNEGFIFANTSEIAGKVLSAPASVKRFVTVKTGRLDLVYGSTNTGGNVLNWLLKNILNLEINASSFNALNEEAKSIHPDTTPIFCPFIDGERSPLWDNNLTGTFFGLKSLHTAAHLYRAVLEGIVFCRRYQFEAMPGKIPDKIKICGGNAKNDLFNSIRATVLKRDLMKSSESELAISGTIRHAMQLSNGNLSILDQSYETIAPDRSLQKAYEKKYKKFLKYLAKAVKN